LLKSKGSKLAVVAMTALAGCTGQVESVGGVAVTQADSAGITIITIAGDPTSLPEGRLTEVPLTVIRGDAAPFLTDVGEVQFRGDGTLLVEDNRSAELRVFARNGEMVRLVGARGDSLHRPDTARRRVPRVGRGDRRPGGLLTRVGRGT